MRSAELFVRYYDTLFSEKNYAREIRYLLQLWSEFNHTPVRRALDVGCGTGGHSIELAKKGCEVLGIDMDGAMLRVAGKKRKDNPELKVTFRKCDIARQHLPYRADVAFAFFYVVNYISSLDYLIRFFGKIRRHLRPRGLFVFDAWNGTATIRKAPVKKRISVQRGG